MLHVNYISILKKEIKLYIWHEHRFGSFHYYLFPSPPDPRIGRENEKDFSFRDKES